MDLAKQTQARTGAKPRTIISCFRHTKYLDVAICFPDILALTTSTRRFVRLRESDRARASEKT